VVHAALDQGVTLFDTANVYPRGARGRSEEFLGQLLGDRRKDIVLATKFGIPMDEGRFDDTSRRTVMASVEESLRRLGTDWIDLYQVHRFDPLTPVEEMLRALDDLVRQGKVRYIGCSRFAAWQVVDALCTSRLHGLNAFISCQDEYSLARARQRAAGRGAGAWAGDAALFPARQRVADGKVPPERAAAAGRPPHLHARALRALRHRAQLVGAGAAVTLLRPLRPQHAGTRLLLAAGATPGFQRDRGCHEA
jgi:aryl-alcohol dehydrogenase-like predicted oxidoreductase